MKKKTSKKKRVIQPPYIPPPPRQKLIDRSYRDRFGHEMNPNGGEHLQVGDKVEHTIVGIVAKVEKFEGDKNPRIVLDVITNTYIKI